MKCPTEAEVEKVVRKVAAENGLNGIVNRYLLILVNYAGMESCIGMDEAAFLADMKRFEADPE